MPSESKTLLTAQTEKPNHYAYLKEFRVEQCPLFLQHKCSNHRPFTCFHWHFMNQRRRRPVRKRDGLFNYCADTYCTKYDETTGLCPDGDECPFLHRTAGDTERRYHLRYFKTCMCVHETDPRGFCTKNGPHCAFAHGQDDLRPPVFDIKELQEMDNPEAQANIDMKGPNALDKERNLMNEDPKWQDTNYVLLNYKTEMCKRPPRLCRQGYACPQYHNGRDKRRSPKKHKYRSTPCPNVKHGDEWGEPDNCEVGDGCSYCHTRTEQQFHPEIYKSTKCNDVQSAGYCPRGVFCAFAHLDEEMALARDLAARIDSGTNLADILSSALPPDNKIQDKTEKADSSGGSGEVSESASTSSLGSNSSHSKAPGSQLAHNKVSNPLGFNSQQDLMQHANLVKKHMMTIDSDPSIDLLEKSRRKQSICLAAYSITSNSTAHLPPGLSPIGMHFYHQPGDTLESVVGNALEDLHLDEPLSFGVSSLEKELERESPSNTLGGLGTSGFGQLGSSAPMNIPGSALSERQLGNFSPTSSPLQSQPSYLSGSRFSFQEDSTLFQSSAYTNHILSNSTSNLGGYHPPGLNSTLFDYGSHPNLSPPPASNSGIHFPHTNSNSYPSSEIQRLNEELAASRNTLASWDERIAQARTACEAWHREAEESNRKAVIAEKERDEAVKRLKLMEKELDLLQGSPYLHGVRRISELNSLSLQMLKQLQGQLRTDCEKVDEIIYSQMARKCMVCEEDKRSVTLGTCNHYVLCNNCAKTQKECPYCQMPINAGLPL